MVFSMQALGLIVGPLVALVLLSSGVSQALSWRLLLGLGVIPAATVIYLRAKMPESPRFQARCEVRGTRRHEGPCSPRVFWMPQESPPKGNGAWVSASS